MGSHVCERRNQERREGSKEEERIRIVRIVFLGCNSHFEAFPGLEERKKIWENFFLKWKKGNEKALK